MALSLERIIWYNFNCFLHVEIFVEEPFFPTKKLLDERWELLGGGGFLVPIHDLRVYCKNLVGNTRKQIGNFVQIFLLNPNFLLAHRNRFSEGMDDGQKTPRGHPDFNSYVKILRVFIWNRWMNRQTDGDTYCVWARGTFFQL